jgi:hypothetical protein
MNEFQRVKKEFIKKVNETILSTDVARSGQTRVAGPKDGVLVRLSPSAAKPEKDLKYYERIKDSDDLFIQGVDFLSRIDFDLLDDETELKVHELLDDFLYLSDNLDEARFNNRVPLSKKIALRRYQRAHKQRIKNNLKKRKRTIQGIIDDKNKKKREKYGQTKDGKRMKKNHISTSGNNRKTK